MIQVVLVKWGRKYGPHYLHGLVAAIRRHTARDLRFVCITDDPAGLSDEIETRPFPDMGLPLEELTAHGGCLPKLAIFAEGLLDPGLKTIYLDIDTGVFGDIGALVDLLDRHPVLHALPNHFLPHWRTPWLSWLTPEGCFFINSSVMVFYPGNHRDIFTDFRRDFAGAYRPGIERRSMALPLRSDERYLSQHEKGRLRALPRSLAGSFKDLYMGPFDRLVRTLPFVRPSRGRIALTFHGNALKPEKVARFEPGQTVRQGGFTTTWRYPEFARYWSEILALEAGEPSAPSRPE